MKSSEHHIAQIILWWVSIIAIICTGIWTLYTYNKSVDEDGEELNGVRTVRSMEKTKLSDSEVEPKDDICQQENPPIKCIFKQE